jgi:ribosomal protein S27AE
MLVLQSGSDQAGGHVEKLGVVIDDEKTKTASTEKSCPKCGTSLAVTAYNQGESVSPPWWCPKCGTAPFEKRPEK